MTDFAGAGDWDLRAVVRGCNFSMDDPHTCFSPLITHNNEADDDLIFGNFVFPEYLFDNNNTANNNSDLDLEDLYKPFYPTSSDHYTNFSPQSTSSEKLVSDDSPVGTAGADADCSKAVGTSKYRKRKNQHKRVVMEVTAEGLSSDMWAWRKYGQKPIKGSPYPRSYYRCSSSRGCPARKQVERSHSDPATFIITYTAEHNHSKPTRRNSLAGTTRQRFSNNNNNQVSTTTNKAAAMEDIVEDKKKTKNKMKNAERIRLKKTEMVMEMEEELLGVDRFIEEAVVEGNITSHDHDHRMMIMSDDFFVDFEEQLNALTVPSSSSNLGFNQQHSVSSSSFW